MGACCNRADNGSPADISAGPDGPDRGEEPAIWKIGAGLLLAGNTMTVGLAISSVEAADNITLFIYIVLFASVVIVFELLGWPLAKGAWQGLKRWRINFDMFFLIAVVAAVGASMVSIATGAGAVYFEVAAILLVIHGIGRRVGTVNQRRAVDAARCFAADDTLVRRRDDNGRLETVASSRLEVGDRIVVGPGDRIVVDGTVHRGVALVRDTEITGETFATARRSGDGVFAGSYSVDGTLEIEATATAGSRVIDEVVDSVHHAWKRPSRWQRQARKTIRWFVPLVLMTTAVTFAAWTVAVDWTTGLFYALAVLLVACPCALGFAVPLAVWMTMGKWAARGMVPAHGQCVETMSRVDTVVFDKTGTLTEPAPGVVDFVIDDDGDVKEPLLRRLVVAVEEQIDHPVARALQTLDSDLCSKRCEPEMMVESTRLIAGLGIEATVRTVGATYRLRIGSTELVDELDDREFWRLERLKRRAIVASCARVVAVVVDDRIAAVAVVDEQVRRRVQRGLERLDEMGLEVGLMTGDAVERTEPFDVDWVHARMTPVQKRDQVRRLQQQGRTVLFVGDGVNDAAAMATADVAIDVDGGAQLAAGVGDLRWCGEHLEAIPDAIDAARQAFSVVRFNLGFATVYNVVGIAVAAAGLLHPVVAAVLMMSSSLFVTWTTTGSLETQRQAPTGDHSPTGGDLELLDRCGAPDSG